MPAAPNLKKFVSLFLKQVQDLENAATDVLISRMLTWAHGKQLDYLGELVGQGRTSLDDEVFRLAIQLRIYINNSSGTPAELAYICQQLSGASSVRYIEIGPAQYRLQLLGVGLIPEGLLETMQALSPGGVRLLGIHLTWPLVPFRVGDRVGERLLHE
jgi:hypothetical protein